MYGTRHVGGSDKALQVYRVDTILILSTGLCCAGSMSSFIAYIDDPINMGGSGVMAMLTFFLTFQYFVGYIGFQIFNGKKCLRKVLH